MTTTTTSEKPSTDHQDPAPLEIGAFTAASEQVFSGLMQYVEAGLPIEGVARIAAMIAGGVQAHCWLQGGQQG